MVLADFSPIHFCISRLFVPFKSANAQVRWNKFKEIRDGICFFFSNAFNSCACLIDTSLSDHSLIHQALCLRSLCSLPASLHITELSALFYLQCQIFLAILIKRNIKQNVFLEVEVSCWNLVSSYVILTVKLGLLCLFFL